MVIYKTFNTILKSQMPDQKDNMQRSIIQENYDNPKTFNTILKTSILKGTGIPDSIQKPILTKKLPEIFSPFELWGTYLSPINNQGKCGNCYAQAVISSLADRFSLLSNGYFKQVLSPYQPTICNGVIDSKNHIISYNDPYIENLAHSSKACTGNTIENIMEYTFAYGTEENSCFDLGVLKSSGINLEADIIAPTDLPYCETVIGKNFDKCDDNITVARFFRCISFYDVYPEEDYIKNEIYHWGPVVSGIIVYNSFLNNYDGTTIYMGPKDENDAVEGGHAIRIVGWGEENGVKFWWVANSWGMDWGLQGYFRIKLGVCDIEKNVMALIPDIKGFPVDILDYKMKPNIPLVQERTWFGVDNLTCYRFFSLPYIKDPKPIIDLGVLPDYKNFWAGEISTNLGIIHKNFSEQVVNITNKHINLFFVFICILITIVLAYILKKRIK